MLTSLPLSGKTSLISSILNLLEHTGTISIDGTDVQTVPKSFLRSRIITIPQDGLELSASLRVNLDPAGENNSNRTVADETLKSVLKRVGLLDAVQGRGGLDMALQRLMLSPVQKQLLCLARAILARVSTKSRIVLIDEATNSIDAIQYKQLQSIIAREFTECTVISVTHHRDGVEFADMVLEMSDGKIARVLNRHTKEIQDLS
jgi:ABC-type multidrug transport system fused ATPase/permease subunit